MGKKKKQQTWSTNLLVAVVRYSVVAALGIFVFTVITRTNEAMGWISRIVPDFFANVHEQHNHRAFMLRMFNVYANTSELNMGLTLRELAEKTRQSTALIGKHARLLSEVKLEEPEYEIVAKSQSVLDLLEGTARAAYETAVEGRSFYYGLANGLGDIVESYEREEYGVLDKQLGVIEDRIVQLQGRYGEIQGGVFRAYKETKEVEDLTTRVSLRLSRDGQELTGTWPVERVSVVAGLGGLLGGFMMMWSSPLLGFVAGSGGGALVGVNRRLEDGRTAVKMADDASQLQLLAVECQTVMYALERFNATLDSLRTSIQASRDGVRYLRHRAHGPLMEEFKEATRAVQTESAKIVAQHNSMLDTWYNYKEPE